ncbi:hypothetical protein PpBr36_04165 [Pyricularia pennisetigena]|uniref:hypothetical protein n=1 Tax=Pyricularia pennisetigena TaxID=1578925 RepID=UPI0011519110|nr:hypothetical protein PpBr36_04165 [Pyricularia pennisetigena]TLS27587.1 hypothetical protein PpBr36_04165 [Pyricularia pennisetigena]
MIEHKRYPSIAEVLAPGGLASLAAGEFQRICLATEPSELSRGIAAALPIKFVLGPAIPVFCCKGWEELSSFLLRAIHWLVLHTVSGAFFLVWSTPPANATMQGEHRQLGMAKQSRAAAARLEWQEHQRDQGRLLTGKKNPGSLPGERPHAVPQQSFNTPRQEQRIGHTSSGTTSTESLSPSNSASHGGLRHMQRQDGGYGAEELSAAQLNGTRSASGSTGSDKRPEIVHARLSWIPKYMRRLVLVSFIGSLGLVMALLEYILSVSNKHMGLGPVDGSRYLWQMAPPAVLLIIAGFWQRFEYQARSTAPWLRMYKGPADAERTVLLDYVSMTRPSVVLRAIQNKDWIVAAAVVMSMLLWTAIIISTGAITTVLVTMTDSNVNVTLTRQFAVDGGGLAQNNSLVTAASKATSLLEVAAFQLGELTTYPDGATNWFAHETFSTNNLAPGAQLTAPVHALFPNLTCEKASLSVNSVSLNEQEQVVNTTLIAPGCAVEFTINGTGLASNRGSGSPTYFLRSGTGGCYGSTDRQDQRIVVAFGVANLRNSSDIDYERFVSSTAAVTLSTPLICRPGYTMRSIDLVRSSSRTIRIRLGSSAPALPNLPGVHPWDLAAGMFKSYQPDVREVAYLLDRVAETDASGYPGFQPARVMIDAYVHFALGFRMGESGSLEAAEEFLDSEKLENLVSNYYRHHASLVAYTLLLRSPTRENSTVTGISVSRFERIGANSAGVHSVVAFVVAAMTVAFFLFFLIPTEGFLPRNPNTLIDTAALLVHSKVFLHNVRGTGGADSKMLYGRLSMAYFYTGIEAYERDFVSENEGYFKVLGGPLPPTTRAPEYFESRGGSWAPPRGVSSTYRALSLSVTLTFIVLLEVMFRISSTNGGLCEMNDEPWAQLFWTVLPAAVAVGLTFYIGLVDKAIRALAPFMELTWGRGTFRTMRVSYLDGSTPRVLYHAIVGRNMPVVLSTLSWIAAALLPVVVAATFDTRAVALQSTDPTEQNQRRMRQDEAATRLLQVLLVLVLVGSTALWCLTPRRRIGILPRLHSESPLSFASIAAMLADGNVVGMLGRGAEWKTLRELELMFRDGLHVTMRFRLGWDEARGRTKRKQDAFGISAIRTGGWGGGESVGLGMQARVGYWQKACVRDWGWRP